LGNNKKLQTITEAISSSTRRNEQQKFNFDLCNALISANIPLNKLNNVTFRRFMETYYKHPIPTESSLRKNYISDVYSETILKIKSIVKDNCVWFTVDETTDSCGRYIVNLLIGVLNENSETKPYLIATKQLDQTNHKTIANFVNDSLTKFYLPQALPNKKILLT
jgi:hypothetical protein